MLAEPMGGCGTGADSSADQNAGASADQASDQHAAGCTAAGFKLIAAV